MKVLVSERSQVFSFINWMKNNKFYRNPELLKPDPDSSLDCSLSSLFLASSIESNLSNLACSLLMLGTLYPVSVLVCLSR